LSEYLPACIWLLSGIVCIVIARKRRLSNSFVRSALVALLGPLAIPFFLMARRDAVKTGY
jgi:hypothetical protein